MLSRFCLLALLAGAAACNKTEPTPSGVPSGSIAPATLNTGLTLLSVGAPAPDVEGVAHNGEKIKLSDLRGKPVVVYFYPKDNTPGCTVEAQEIRDLWQEIGATGAVVIGVSTDDATSHQKFAADHELPFLLLPDPSGVIAQKFGVPLRNGRASRVTFVIGKDGTIAKVFPDVKPKGHGAELVDALKSS
ncbi:MAG TPA: peroxiredoxin [Polyangiaceae bacterium]|nr:peroxiredoxin [Polyangiaceae bacterium]